MGDYFRYILKYPNAELFLSVECSYQTLEEFKADLILTPELEHALVFDSIQEAFNASGFIKRIFGIILYPEHLLEIFGDKVVIP